LSFDLMNDRTDGPFRRLNANDEAVQENNDGRTSIKMNGYENHEFTGNSIVSFPPNYEVQPVMQSNGDRDAYPEIYTFPSNANEQAQTDSNYEAPKIPKSKENK
jgi:hypothetical protein